LSPTQLTGRSAPPRSRIARALAAAVAALALTASAALAQPAAVADPAPTAAQAPLASPPSSPEPDSQVAPTPAPPVVQPAPVEDPSGALTGPATPVAEAPPATSVPGTAPEPTDGSTAPGTTDPVVAPPPVTGITPITVPLVDVPPGRPDPSPAATVPAPSPEPVAVAPVTATPAPVAAPERLPEAAPADDPPAAETPAPAKVAPVAPPMTLSPNLTTDGSAATALASAAPAVGTANRVSPLAVKQQAQPKVAAEKFTQLTVPLVGSQADRAGDSGSILQFLAAYVFPGAASNMNGAILLLFPLALLLAALTPRVPRLHLATIVAERGTGTPGYNPVAQRPG